MKKILLITGIILFSSVLQAQSKQEQEVAKTVERLRKAMVDGNKSELESLVSDNLSYGHSGGHIDTKNDFIEKLTTGKSDFVTMDLTEQTISINKKTAVVRHTLDAKTNDNNKPAEVHLKVLLIFQKQSGRWILLARQAVHPT